MPLPPDELHARFLREIDRRGASDRFIDGDEERELLQIALQYGYDSARGRSVLAEACHARGYVVERDVRFLVQERLRSLVAAGHGLTRQQFEQIVKEALAMVNGTTQSEADIRRLVITEIDDAGTIPIATSWWGNWYRRLKKSLRMA